jgi:hypothetical protein
LAVANKSEYARLVNAAIKYGKDKGGDLEGQVDAAMNRLVRGFSLLNMRRRKWSLYPAYTFVANS